MELCDQLELLEDTIVALLKKADLGVNTVILGDRCRVNELRPPTIWVLPADSSLEWSGLGEMWKYRFVVAAVVESKDVRKGHRKANKIAANASAALVKSRNLDGTVRNVKRVEYLPGDTGGMNADQLHSAGYTMEAEFRYLEQEA